MIPKGETIMLKQISNRPLLFFVLSFSLGMIISAPLSFSLKAAVVITAAIFAIFIILYRRLSYFGKGEKAIITLPVIIGIAVGAVFQHLALAIPQSKITSLDGSEHEVLAVVEEVTYRADYFSAYTVRIVSVDEKSDGFDCALSIPYDIGAEENDVLRLKVLFSIPEKDNYGFALREYYASRGIYISAEAVDENAVIAGFDRSIPSYFRKLSGKLSVTLKTVLGRENGGFVSGLLLGRKGDIPDSVSTSFRYLGISHILSVSGLHLTILTASLSMLLKTLGIRKSLRLFASVFFIIAFILLTGARPAVMRSGIMMLILILSQLTSKDYDAITSLSLASFIIILVSPASIFDAGFILSVSATAGIILLGAPITKLAFHLSEGRNVIIRLLLKLASLVAITASATLFTLPAIWYFFGEISAVSLITNLLFVPLNTILMYMALIFLIFSPTVLSPAFGGMTSSLARLITELSDSFSKILPPPIDLTYPFTVIAVVFAVCVMIYFSVKRKRCMAVILSLSVFCASYAACLLYYNRIHEGEEHIACVNIKSNDYIFVNAEGKTLLCDFSDGGYSNINRASGLCQPLFHDVAVDTVLITHLHRKHIEAVSRLSDNDRLKQIFIPSPLSEDERFFSEAIKDAASKRGVEVITYSSDRDVTFDFNGIKITLCKKAYIGRSVQPIHLMKIEGKRTLLYIGSAVFESDLREKAEEELSHADIIFLGSHGPLIKEALPNINFSGEIIVSNEETNEAYGTGFTTLNYYKRFVTR